MHPFLQQRHLEKPREETTHMSLKRLTGLYKRGVAI